MDGETAYIISEELASIGESLKSLVELKKLELKIARGIAEPGEVEKVLKS